VKKAFLYCWFFLALSIQLLSAQAKPAQGSEDRHLHNIRQLTFGGQNAEAYFSADGKQLIFQSTRDTLQCDQIFVMNVDGSNQHMVSTGKGRTTCSYFFHDGKKILYSSTHLGGAGPDSRLRMLSCRTRPNPPSRRRRLPPW